MTGYFFKVLSGFLLDNVLILWGDIKLQEI